MPLRPWGSLDPGKVLTNTLAYVETLLGVESAAVLRFDRRFETFDVLSSRGITDDFLAALRDRPANDDLPSIRALSERTPIQVSDTESALVNPDLRPV